MPYTKEQIEILRSADENVQQQVLEQLTEEERVDLISSIKLYDSGKLTATPASQPRQKPITPKPASPAAPKPTIKETPKDLFAEAEAEAAAEGYTAAPKSAEMYSAFPMMGIGSDQEKIHNKFLDVREKAEAFKKIDLKLRATANSAKLGSDKARQEYEQLVKQRESILTDIEIKETELNGYIEAFNKGVTKAQPAVAQTDMHGKLLLSSSPTGRTYMRDKEGSYYDNPRGGWWFDEKTPAPDKASGFNPHAVTDRMLQRALERKTLSVKSLAGSLTSSMAPMAITMDAIKAAFNADATKSKIETWLNDEANQTTWVERQGRKLQIRVGDGAERRNGPQGDGYYKWENHPKEVDGKSVDNWVQVRVDDVLDPYFSRAAVRARKQKIEEEAKIEFGKSIVKTQAEKFGRSIVEGVSFIAGGTSRKFKERGQVLDRTTEMDLQAIEDFNDASSWTSSGFKKGLFKVSEAIGNSIGSSLPLTIASGGMGNIAKVAVSSALGARAATLGGRVASQLAFGFGSAVPEAAQISINAKSDIQYNLMEQGYSTATATAIANGNAARLGAQVLLGSGLLNASPISLESIAGRVLKTSASKDLAKKVSKELVELAEESSKLSYGKAIARTGLTAAQESIFEEGPQEMWERQARENPFENAQKGYLASAMSGLKQAYMTKEGWETILSTVPTSFLMGAAGHFGQGRSFTSSGKAQIKAIQDAIASQVTPTTLPTIVKTDAGEEVEIQDTKKSGNVIASQVTPTTLPTIVKTDAGEEVEIQDTKKSGWEALTPGEQSAQLSAFADQLKMLDSSPLTTAKVEQIQAIASHISETGDTTGTEIMVVMANNPVVMSGKSGVAFVNDASGATEILNAAVTAGVSKQTITNYTSQVEAVLKNVDTATEAFIQAAKDASVSEDTAINKEHRRRQANAEKAKHALRLKAAEASSQLKTIMAEALPVISSEARSVMDKEKAERREEAAISGPSVKPVEEALKESLAGRVAIAREEAATSEPVSTLEDLSGQPIMSYDPGEIQHDAILSARKHYDQTSGRSSITSVIKDLEARGYDESEVNEAIKDLGAEGVTIVEDGGQRYLVPATPKAPFQYASESEIPADAKKEQKKSEKAVVKEKKKTYDIKDIKKKHKKFIKEVESAGVDSTLLKSLISGLNIDRFDALTKKKESGEKLTKDEKDDLQFFEEEFDLRLKAIDELHEELTDIVSLDDEEMTARFITHPEEREFKDGMTPQQFREAVSEYFGEAFAKKLEASGLMKIETRKDEFKGIIPEGANALARRKTQEAFFKPGAVYSKAHAAALIMHEIGVHVAIRDFLTPEKWNELKELVVRSVRNGDKVFKGAWENVFRLYIGYTKKAFAELYEVSKIQARKVALPLQEGALKDIYDGFNPEKLGIATELIEKNLERRYRAMTPSEAEAAELSLKTAVEKTIVPSRGSMDAAEKAKILDSIMSAIRDQSIVVADDSELYTSSMRKAAVASNFSNLVNSKVTDYGLLIANDAFVEEVLGRIANHFMLKKNPTRLFQKIMKMITDGVQQWFSRLPGTTSSLSEKDIYATMLSAISAKIDKPNVVSPVGDVAMDITDQPKSVTFKIGGTAHVVTDVESVKSLLRAKEISERLQEDARKADWMSKEDKAENHKVIGELLSNYRNDVVNKTKINPFSLEVTEALGMSQLKWFTANVSDYVDALSKRKLTSIESVEKFLSGKLIDNAYIKEFVDTLSKTKEFDSEGPKPVVVDNKIEKKEETKQTEKKLRKSSDVIAETIIAPQASEIISGDQALSKAVKEVSKGVPDQVKGFGWLSKNFAPRAMFTVLNGRFFKLTEELRKFNSSLGDVKKAFSNFYETLGKVASDPIQNAQLGFALSWSSANEYILSKSELANMFPTMTSETMSAYASALFSMRKASEIVVKEAESYYKKVSGKLDARLKTLESELTNVANDKTLNEDEVKKQSASISKKIDDLKSQLKELKDSSDKFIKQINGRKVYWPMARFGQYKVEVTKKSDGTCLAVFLTENKGEAGRKEVQEQMTVQAAAYPELEQALKANDVVISNMTTLAELNDEVTGNSPYNIDMSLITYLNAANKVSPDTAIQIEGLVMSETVRKTFEAHLKQREGVPGWSTDAYRVFDSYVHGLSNMVANMRHGLELDDLQRTFSEKELGHAKYDRNLETTAREMISNAKRPPYTKLANRINQAGFLIHIGFRPAFVIAQKLQQMQSLLPAIGNFFGYSKAAAAIATANMIAYKTVGWTKLDNYEFMTTAEVEGWVERRIKPENFMAMSSDPDVRKAIAETCKEVIVRASKEGSLDSAPSYGFADSALKRAGDEFTKKAGMFALKFEQINRITALIAWTSLSVANGKVTFVDKSGFVQDEASETQGKILSDGDEKTKEVGAIYATAETINELSNYIRSRGNQPRYLRQHGALGNMMKMAFNYKPFSIGYIAEFNALGIINARKAGKNKLKKTLAYAKTQLVGLGINALLGGPKAWVYFSLLDALVPDEYLFEIYRAIEKKFKEVMSRAGKALGIKDPDKVADSAYFAATHGMPNIAGIDVSAMLQGSLIDTQDTPEATLGAMAFGATPMTFAGAAGVLQKRGFNVPALAAAGKKLAPSAVRGPIETISGKASVGGTDRELTAGERALRLFSITPTELAKDRQKATTQFEAKAFVRHYEQKFAQEFKVLDHEDPGYKKEEEKLIEAVKAFNTENKELYKEYGIQPITGAKIKGLKVSAMKRKKWLEGKK